MTKLTLLTAASLFLFGCGGDAAAPGEADADAGPASASPTYYRDIKPLVDAMCAGCHYDGGIAPFSMTKYEQVAAHAGVASLAVAEGTMPPWLATDGCNDYVGDRSLSSDQIAVIQRWAELGAPAGDPADEGPPLEVEDISLSGVDYTIEMAEAYTPTVSPDDHRCFLIEWPERFDSTRYITGFRVNPGNASVAHHAIAFLAKPEDKEAYYALDAAEDGAGYRCFGGTRGPSNEWVASWAPGSQGSDLPPGLGIEIPPGSMIVLQMHYNLSGGGTGSDQTSIDFRLDEQVAQVARVQPFTNPAWVRGGMPIEAGDDDAMHSFSVDPSAFINGGRPFLMHSVFLHMHNLGSSGVVRIERLGGGEECLLDIPRWDFDWQGSYGLRAPVRFDPGDRVYLECHWDNSATNQPRVDGQPLPPRDLNWGDGTSDEMCLSGWLMSDVPM